MTSYVPDSTIYYRADGADYQYNVTGLTAGQAVQNHHQL